MTRELGPTIEEADKALDSGSVDKVVKLVTDEATAAIRRRFTEAHEKQAQAERNVEAGRAFVSAYVEYVHYVEALHRAAQATDAHHGGIAKQARRTQPSTNPPHNINTKQRKEPA
jgi:hypothetical protein